MSVDSILVHSGVAARGVALYKQAEIAVELDETSHADKPFPYERARWVAMDHECEGHCQGCGAGTIRLDNRAQHTQEPASLELLTKAMADNARTRLGELVD